MSTLCRHCTTFFDGAGEPGPEQIRCPACGAHELLRHPELATLAIAHIDCDAFYASVEKRDRPELRDRPVVVGGGRRGVVTAACYVARLYGLHSAMPMFKALKACPEAVVIRPDMAKYQRIGREIRQMMLAVTPLVEPLSIDEAFLDLSGTEVLHGAAPAATLARLARRIEETFGLTASIGLSYNKFLAKIASDQDKPRGFAVIGRAEAPDFLAGRPVGLIWGVGKSLAQTLTRDGIKTVGDLRHFGEAALIARYGKIGRRLHRFARGEDDRQVEPNAAAKSISAETTFDKDEADSERLLALLWPLCERVAARLKRADCAGHTITVKLKTRDFRSISRSRRLADPTHLAEVLYRTARPLVLQEANGRAFRLIGVGASDLVAGAAADPPSLLDPARHKAALIEGAIDAVRAKLGEQAIGRGRAFTFEPPPHAGVQQPDSGSASSVSRSARRAKSP